ncbi:MAG: hypothetical protein GWP14_10345 [Actinobacteria bacterium]|nr:hypothetical protein [Actinomycetota bacterium]
MMGIDPKELRERKWPLPPFAIGQEVADRILDDSDVASYDDYGEHVIPKEGLIYAKLPFCQEYPQGCYVDEGELAIIPLEDPQTGKQLPADECGIVSLVKDDQGRIFGLSCGQRSHLFVYDPKSEQTDRSVISLGVLDGKAERHSLVVSSDGRLFFASQSQEGQGHIYRCSYDGSSTQIEELALPVGGEGICALAIDDKRNCLYGLSDKTGIFFVLHPDSAKVELKGPVDEDHLFSPVLVVSPDGCVYGGRKWGQFFKYDAEQDAIIAIDLEAPSIRGRQIYNSIDALELDGTGRFIYGGSSADGILFHFDWKAQKVIALGKPLNQPRIRCLAFGKDGCLYGIAGKECCHLFRYNPDSGELADLGICFVSSPRCWHSYEFDAAVAGDDGTIYLGQNERISYLFSYRPPE